jgi:hypothetical protein
MLYFFIFIENNEFINQISGFLKHDFTEKIIVYYFTIKSLIAVWNLFKVRGVDILRQDSELHLQIKILCQFYVFWGINVSGGFDNQFVSSKVNFFNSAKSQ